MSAYDQTGEVYKTIQAIGLALHDGPMLGRDLRAAVRRAGANPNLIQDAAKLIRRSGKVLYATKAGKHSTWYHLATTPRQIADWHNRMAGEAFSQLIDAIRSIDEMGGVTTTRHAMIRDAIALGVPLGFTEERVLALCEPVPLGYDPFAE